MNALPSPASIEWTEVWPGVMKSVLAGKPEQAGSPFVVLYRTSAPVEISAHSNPSEERVTVLHGCVELGLGEPGGAVQELGPGSYAVIPGGVPHSIRYREGSLVQVHGVGPFDTRQAA